MRPDIECLAEKYWGEILERTLSSNSLHALQRTYGDMQHNTNSCKILNSITPTKATTNTTPRTRTISDIHSISGKMNTTNHLGYLSSSEPKLCEHDLHDITCAKNRAFFGGFNRLDDGI